jgi:mannose-6-phosphate isomerase-like protein (cupin superfamily)
MPIRVYDYRNDLQNLVVRPEGRARFRRVELGPVPPMHSHDLGVETFLVLEGNIEFNVEVCQPGQLISVPPRTRHAVRAVGERPGAIYLSVAPHVEPTHTFYDEHGSCLPPRYGSWLEAGGGEARTSSMEDLLATYRTEAARLLELATALAQAAHALPAIQGKESIDELWSTVSPLLEEVRRLEQAWNALAVAGGTGG